MLKSSVIWQVLKSIKPMQILRLLTGTPQKREWVDLREPSAIERLGAVGDPKGETAKRVARWDRHQERVNDMLGRAAAVTDRMLERFTGK